MATTIGTSWTQVASKSATVNGATITFYLEAKRGTQSVANNTTPIDVRLRSVFSGYYMYSYGYSFSASYCTTKSSSSGQWNAATETILTGSKTVSHNADGTWSGTLTANATMSSLFNLSMSGSVSVPTIPRASTPTFSQNGIGLNGVNSVTIYTNRASNSFTHQISWKVGNKTGSLGTAITDSVKWTPPMSLITEFYNLASTPATITTKTYNGSTLIGTTTKDLTIYNPGGDGFSLSTNNITISSRSTSLNIISAPRYSGFGHNVYYKVSGASEHAIHLGQPTFPVNWRPYLVLQDMPTKTTTTVEVIVRTTYNNQVIYDGERKQTLTVNVDTSVYKPTISNFTLTEQDSVAAALETPGDFIRYISDVLVSATVGMVADSGSTLKNVKIENGNQSVTQTSGTVSSAFRNITGNSFKITATDTRGVSATETKAFNLVPYVLLTIAASQEREDPTSDNVIANYNGAYYDGSLGQVANELEITYQYKESGSSTWIDGTGTLTATPGRNSTYEGSGTLAEALSYQKQYDLRITATDKIMTVTRQLIVYQGIPIYHWGVHDTNGNHFDIEGDLLIHEEGVPTRYIELETSHITTQSGSYTDTRKFLGVGAGIYDTNNNPLLIPSGDDSVSYWQSINTGIYWKGSLSNVDNLPFGYGFLYVFRSNTEVAIIGVETGTNRLWKKWVNSSTSSPWLQTVMNTGTSDGSSSITWESILNRNWGSNLLKVNHTGMVQFRLNATWTANTNGATLCTLPAGYRPTTEIVQNVKQNGTLNTDSYIQITTAGLVKIFGMTAASGVRHTFNFYAG